MIKQLKMEKTYYTQVKWKWRRKRKRNSLCLNLFYLFNLYLNLYFFTYFADVVTRDNISFTTYGWKNKKYIWKIFHIYIIFYIYVFINYKLYIFIYFLKYSWNKDLIMGVTCLWNRNIPSVEAAEALATV